MSGRLPVNKTYKIYIGGKFPRTESGRYFEFKSGSGQFQANICLSSRKDFRDAVVAARKALGGWSGMTAYNRGQILYRIAEMIEGRRDQFVSELMIQGSDGKAAASEVDHAIDRFIYYAGWTDKFQQVFGSVNPVASSHFNFSIPEPTGVVSILAPEDTSLIGLVSQVAPAIAGGNTCVVLASMSKPLCSISLAEVLNSSDVPGGVVNILTGSRDELIAQFSSHMDVNAIVCCGDSPEEMKLVQENATLNVKRDFLRKTADWTEFENPSLIMDTQEIKTTWHPIGT
jgi:acyl-CoA reductase-like NAD-dependent aldehyde dehydrogenase